MASYFLLLFFVKKLGKGIQFCVNYKKLSTITKKDCYLISFIEKTLAQIEGTKYFIKIDIHQTFYQIRITKNSKELTIFPIKFDAFKYLIMLFG